MSPLHPSDVVVDIPVVDQVVDAVVQGDRTSLLALAASPEEASADPEVTGTPEDGDREDGGDASPPANACTEDVYPGDELSERMDAFLESATGAEGPLRLYAVVGAPGGEDVDPEFSAVFAFEGGEGRQVWIDPNGAGIVWFSLGCDGLAPGDLLRLDEGDLFFWLRPVAPEPLDPVQ